MRDVFFFSSRRRHTRFDCDWSSDVCSSDLDEAAQIAEQERQVMTWFADLLRKDGLPVRGVSVGSTPAMAAVKSLTGVTEARPGNYIFYDRTMVLIGCCEPQDVAVSVLATVVSHQPGAAHFVVDAGALSLSKDAGPAHLGLETAFGEEIGRASCRERV